MAPCSVVQYGTLYEITLTVYSVLVRNQSGEVLKASDKKGDLAAAEHTLTTEWGYEFL
ncbi:MAG: hypothetical protein JOZ14_03100 [Acidobacteria bacterium]|nr:hypothetical protein [Acidobacteriota bacterium]